MLLNRVIMVLFALVIPIIGVFFFASSGSYQNSLQARVEYFLGNYKDSYTLAKKAYKQDKYNKMAFTLVTQSQIALKYASYIEQGNTYLNSINQISLKSNVDSSDKAKIKMMCQVMIEEYKNLSPTKMTHESLIENSKNMFEKFKEIYNELF